MYLVDQPAADNEVAGLEPESTTRKHKTLKKPVVTRWNSALHMIASILDNIDAVDH